MAKTKTTPAPGTDTAAQSAEKKTVAKKETAFPNGFTKLSEKQPAVYSHSSVQSSSKHLVLLTKDGKEITGTYNVWLRDMNAPHIQAKRGDSFFSSLSDGMPVKDVIGYHYL